MLESRLLPLFREHHQFLGYMDYLDRHQAHCPCRLSHLEGWACHSLHRGLDGLALSMERILPLLLKGMIGVVIRLLGRIGVNTRRRIGTPLRDMMAVVGTRLMIGMEEMAGMVGILVATMADGRDEVVEEEEGDGDVSMFAFGWVMYA